MSKTVNPNAAYKDEICTALSEELGMTKVDAEKVFNALFFKVIPDMLKDNKDVCVKGFGIFQSKQVPERVKRNPKENKPITVPADRTLHFKKGSGMKKF